MILKEALLDNADCVELILREAGVPESDNARPVSVLVEVLNEITEHKYDRLRFEIRVTCQNKSQALSPPPAHLYDPVIQFFLTLVDLPYWAKGHAEAGLTTKNPESSWCIVSENPQTELKLIRVRLA